jgi:hypothetical protein
VRVMYTHPYFAVEYIRQREHDLAAQVRHGQPGTRRTRVRPSLRHRVGWRLVEIGLTLARGSALEVR